MLLGTPKPRLTPRPPPPSHRAHATLSVRDVELMRILQRVRDAGIRNILALRGDSHDVSGNQWRPPRGGFRNAIELVRLIREEHGDYFCIGVAGYSEVHSESWNSSHLRPSARVRALDISRLKAKVDAGADFVVTQHFYDVDGWLDWRKRAKAAGIGVPIIPGYLVVQNYSTFERFTEWCRTRVPPDVARDLAKVKNDDRAVKEYGVELALETCRTLVAQRVRALHFFSTNLVEPFIRIIDELAPELGLDHVVEGTSTVGGAARAGRDVSAFSPMPLAVAAGSSPPAALTAGAPAKEGITHTARALSKRLSDSYGYANFPNGRWGDRSSPAYGQLTDHYLANKRNCGSHSRRGRR